MRNSFLFLIILAVIAPPVFSYEIDPPEPFTVERGTLTQMKDGTTRYTTETFVEQTRVSRAILGPEGLVCEVWNLEERSQKLLRGRAACEEIFGDRAAEVMSLGARLAQGSQNIAGPAWMCTNDAIQRVEEYNSCDVTVIEYEEGGSTQTDRTFSFGELNYEACSNWCMTHWQEEGSLGDLIYTCTGDHDVGAHPPYGRP